MLNMSHIEGFLIQHLPSSKKIEYFTLFFMPIQGETIEKHFIDIHTYCSLLINSCINIHIAV